MRRFQKKYIDTVAPKMRQAFGYTNTLAIPKIEKVVLNAGLSKGLNDKKYQDAVERTLQRISGQKPVMTKAKKSISNFKIREGMVVGAKVTIRGGRMYDFLDKLVSVALPRMRDFHGLDPEKGFDGHGNFSLGFREHIPVICARGHCACILCNTPNAQG